MIAINSIIREHIRELTANLNPCIFPSVSLIFQKYLKGNGNFFPRVFRFNPWREKKSGRRSKSEDNSTKAQKMRNGTKKHKNATEYDKKKNKKQESRKA